MDELKLEKINENHLRLIGDFCCGCGDEKSLSDYLKGEAYRDSLEGEGMTFVLSSKLKNETLGYFTLRSSSLQAKRNESNIIIPCIEISRFAVHSQYRNKKIGTSLMLNGVMKIVKVVGEYIGVKGIMLFSLDNSVGFYEKFGFKEFNKDIQSLLESYSEDCCGMFALLDEDKKIIYDKTAEAEAAG